MARIENFYRVAKLSQKFNIPRQTIQSAVARGELPSRKTGCGLPLVALTDMEEWVDKSQKSEAGRPFKTPTPTASDETLRQLLLAAEKDPELAAKIESVRKSEKG